MRRKKMSSGKSKRLFKRTATSVHKKNGQGASYAMRGGIRL